MLSLLAEADSGTAGRLLAFAFVCFNDGYDVVLLPLISAELNVVTVGGQRVVSLSPLEEYVSVTFVSQNGGLVDIRLDV